jgi:hypothetical protein
MKRISKWLKSKFSRHSAEADGHHAPLEVRPEENVKGENSACDDTAPLAILKSREESPFVVFESTGFDPYNSGSIDTSKAWKSHSQYKRPF